MTEAIPLDQYQRDKGELLNFLTYQEMLKLPEPEWLVEGVVLKQSTALLFGKSNSFKSFLAVDIGMSIATGIPWHGNRVKSGKVCFVATEGANGIGRLRIPTWMESKGATDNGNAFLYPQELCLDIVDQVTALIDTMNSLGRFALVVFDIFGGTMTGSEIEDSTARKWVHGVQRILRETSASVLVIAHSPYQDDSRIRGHSHFWGSFDTRLKAEGDKDALTTSIQVERHKDADSTGSWGFQMEKVGDSLVPTLDANVKTPRSHKLTAAQQRALDALDDAVLAHGVTKPDRTKWPSIPVVALDRWKTECDRHAISASDKANSRLVAFQRAQGVLVEKKLIRVYDGHVWRCFDA